MNDWGPGCEPRWWATNSLRWIAREGEKVLQQRYVLQGYGVPTSAEEWRDVPTASEAE